MRCLLKVSIPTDIGNERIADGTLGRTIESILNDLKPEAAYFAEEQGLRTGFIVCNVEKESQIPAIAEPWFLAFNARVEFHPAMTLADLKSASPSFEKSARIYAGHRRQAA